MGENPFPSFPTGRGRGHPLGSLPCGSEPRSPGAQDVGWRPDPGNLASPGRTRWQSRCRHVKSPCCPPLRSRLAFFTQQRAEGADRSEGSWHSWSNTAIKRHSFAFPPGWRVPSWLTGGWGRGARAPRLPRGANTGLRAGAWKASLGGPSSSGGQAEARRKEPRGHRGLRKRQGRQPREAVSHCGWRVPLARESQDQESWGGSLCEGSHECQGCRPGGRAALSGFGRGRVFSGGRAGVGGSGPQPGPCHRLPQGANRKP